MSRLLSALCSPGTLVLILVLVLAAPACTSGQREIAWTHFVIADPLPGDEWGTGGLPLVDLDGDGDLDIALSRRQVQTFYWFERRSDEEWIRHVVLQSPEIEHGLGAAATDVDLDGHVDLVFTGVWFRNPGNLPQEPDQSWQFERFDGGGHDILAADISGDGQADIVTFDGDQLSWFAVPAPLQARSIASDIGHHGGITPHGAGDIDGDGDLDLVVAGSWFENPGGGEGTWPRHPWPHVPIPGASYGTSIRSWVADIDHDQLQDIVYSDCDTSEGQVYWVRNLGGGTDWASTRLELPETPPGQVAGSGSFHSLAVADFDLDGDLDIFAGEQEDPSIDLGEGRLPMKQPGLRERGIIWVNSGGAPPTFTPIVIQEDNPGWHDAAVGDVDGDGDPDLVSKVWNKDGPNYHADFWRNDRIRRR